MRKLIKPNYKAFIIACIAIVAILFATYSFNIGYAIKIDNQVVGIVNNKNDVANLKKDINEKLEAKLDRNVDIPQNITYERVFKIGEEILSKDKMITKIEESIDFSIEAYILTIDGKDFAVLGNKEQIEDLLNNIKLKYINKEVIDINEIGFVEDIEIKKAYVNSNMIQNIEEVKSRIEIPLKQVKTYEIKKGDTIWDIAMKHEIDTREIERLNPNINIDNIQIGQAINLTFPRSVLNVRIIKEHQYEEKIPYETTYEESSELYEDDVKVKIRGKEGKKEVISEIVYINGIEENRQIINEKILEEPKTEVFLKGTKERPETLAYGNFMPPSRGKLTSRFGPRWGRTHTGIDIGVPIGTPNKAADGGKVIFAGWKGSYGELVIIDHENGYQTYYGHNSVIKVKEGELVYRGQVIALSGATGRVTGPNLHFEVRKNGQPVDPLKFIKY